MAVGAVVEVSGAVVAESIEDVAARAVSAERVAAPRSGDRRAAVWHEDRPEVLQYAVQWVVAPQWARAGVLQYAERWVAALPWVRAGAPLYADRRVAAPPRK